MPLPEKRLITRPRTVMLEDINVSPSATGPPSPAAWPLSSMRVEPPVFPSIVTASVMA